MHGPLDNITAMELEDPPATTLVWAMEALAVLLLVLPCCTRLTLGPACIYPIVTAVTGLIGYAIEMVDEILAALVFAWKHLPWAWYFLTALTLLPVCLSNFTSKGFTVGFFAIYCTTALLLCMGLPDPYRIRLMKQRLLSDHATKLKGAMMQGKGGGLFANTRIQL